MCSSKLDLNVFMQILTSLDIYNLSIFYFLSSQEAREILHTQAQSFTSPVVKKCKEVIHFNLEAIMPFIYLFFFFCNFIGSYYVSFLFAHKKLWILSCEEMINNY
jgi:hypothetical protein